MNIINFKYTLVKAVFLDFKNKKSNFSANQKNIFIKKYDILYAKKFNQI